MRRDLRIIRGCAIAITVIIAIAASVAAADILAPMAIAIVLALVLAPVARAMERIGFPPGVSAVFAVVVTVCLLSAIGMAMAPAVNAWVARVPAVVQNVERKLQPIEQQLAAVEGNSQRIVHASAGGLAAAASDGVLEQAARLAPGILAKIVYVTILTIFLLACRRAYTERLILLPSRFHNRVRISRICRDVRLRVSQYLFTLTLINLGLVAVTTASFYVAGIADPFLWGVAFGLLNFIPVVGPTAVILAAALVGFADAATIMQALAAPLILLGINTIEANLVQPWLLSRRIVISPVAIFVMAVTLVWMWGAPAAITAVPILIIFHTISLHVPALRPVALLLATETGRPESTHSPRV
jgi:predicted PurR-regulated permease PerM